VREIRSYGKVFMMTKTISKKRRRRQDLPLLTTYGNSMNSAFGFDYIKSYSKVFVE